MQEPILEVGEALSHTSTPEKIAAITTKEMLQMIRSDMRKSALRGLPR
jgi:hypothetical protein